MEPKGIRDKPVVGLEIEGELPRAYYYCASCKEGFFPPQPAAPPGDGPVE